MEQPFKMVELDDALKILIDTKSPGPDKITNAMLTHLGNKAKTKLLGIFNNSWTKGKVPQEWRKANMVPILKKGKDKKNVSSYRPISLTSCTGKLLERMVNNRLSWYLEDEKILCQEQAGFRQNRSTEDQVTYIAQSIEDGLQDKKHTLAVWVDLEKAFDKVWKEGLKLKLKRCGVSGNMYRWISSFLNNRKARVQANGKYSREKTLKEGVPQGGVLSPTLFLVFINDIIKDLPRHVKGAMYADDLVLWCTEESLPTANYRLQAALKNLQSWTEQWAVSINAAKTTYTIFSMSTKNQTAKLFINVQQLPLEQNPTYLGVTFDKRLTWKAQTEKTEQRAKSRLTLMKKLSSTNWGADANILRKLYVGRVRPTLEYGVTAWGTAAKSNFSKTSKVQNQATRIITGAMRSTPIQELEAVTGLESMEARRDTKILCQAAKFKRLPDHPMSNRIHQAPKTRLKRGSFVQQAETLGKNSDGTTQQVPIAIPSTLENLPCKENVRPKIQCSVPGVNNREDQSGLVRRAITLEYIQQNFPAESWTRVFTDGSADSAMENGGAGVCIQCPGKEEDLISVPTGRFSNNFTAEATAILQGAKDLLENLNTPTKVVFLSDAKSVLEAIDHNKNKELNPLFKALSVLANQHEVVLQWIPAHCGISGNEKADSLAKEGSLKEQTNNSTTYHEAKTIVKNKQSLKWKTQRPNHNKLDPYYNLKKEKTRSLFSDSEQDTTE